MWNVIGHERAAGLLQRAVENERVSHAYLFAGPSQVGKMVLGLNFAQALNCRSEDRPCQTCSSCTRIAMGKHPDVQVIGLTVDEKSREGRLHKEIRIDQVRAMQHGAALLPYEGHYKVFIIDGAERLSEEASNSLLKTLEEPPPHVVLLLLTVNDKLLLATVLSRCQKVDLRPLPVAAVQEALMERWQVAGDEAKQLARLSGGRLGWALAAYRDKEMLRERRARLSAMVSLMEANRNERLAFAADLASAYSRSREPIEGILDLWLAWWRDLLLVKGGCLDRIANIDWADELPELSLRYSLEQMKGFIELVQETKLRLAQNVNPRLALDVLMLDMPGRGHGT